MEKICLNFLNEKANINLPSNLKSLKKEISKHFCLSESDTEGLHLKYIKDSEIKEIKSENDLKKFIKDKINEININIDNESKIYKNNKKELKDNHINLRKELNELEKEKNNLEEEKKKILLEAKDLLIKKKK